MLRKNLLNQQRGFTLIESLIVFSIVIILSGLIIPTFKHIFQKSHNQILSSQLMRAIHFARMQSITKHEMILLCKSQNQQTCSGDWEDGYIVHSKNKVLLSFLSSEKQGQLHWRAFPIFVNDLEFLPSGLPNFQNGTFWYCETNAVNPVWAIVINQMGRARLVYAEGESGIQDDKGKKLEC